MQVNNLREIEGGKYVFDILLDNGEFYFTSHSFDTQKDALKWIDEWLSWANNVSNGRENSIYYILQVPDTWPGSSDKENPYSGLYVKIGRSNNVLKRLSNLQTGTFGQLIIHALEPGGAQKENELHEKFKTERRQGEWFICTRELTRHIFTTWFKYKMLPPEHQIKIMELSKRINTYSYIHNLMGGKPDLLNPSINDPWISEKYVLVDLVYSSLAKKGNSKKN
ncbi:TPA: GIY-YIG nuclease family protein [Enterobacter cloacae]|uniref:GIY-YIG nuclease family protein n=1 Tax=Enterobacter cloacae complex TaxID=354276 RepID=UPI00077BD256|nr:GIY-YIG nuclease family protein [Enterobacter cloacae]HBM7665258.1 GIY-YIG nuclease family protein [Enterobacter cloacae subsp. cloacae]HCR2005197.1 GIY-YIG nuclease family protein [Enterobacter cloacae subsp. dissolvens]MCK6806020.1 GIY-YIG nuclease family protein [Enterobacter cloacae]MCK6828654.1 GIY-YIG nuclease family protein [Enterobacter cloacae]MCM7172590.1 GIY-YIG nuclease family protein [Enterobacter cloacae]